MHAIDPDRSARAIKSVARPNTWLAEASALGLLPGAWPAWIDVRLGGIAYALMKASEVWRGDDLVEVVYLGRRAGVELRIAND